MKKMGLTWPKALPFILIACGIIGLTASFALTYDKLHVLADPNYQPSCNLNPVISCGSVMKTSQAELLRTPNTIFGLVAFAMLTMFGLGILAGATFKRWLWWSAQCMATAGVGFVLYLFFQSVFRIQAICPWCFVVWLTTILVFVSVTVCNIRSGNFGSKQPEAVEKVLVFVSHYGLDLLLWWYALLLAILGSHFWYYWRTLF